MGTRGIVLALCAVSLTLFACEPTSGTDREKHRRMAKWCEICPVWCDTDLRPMPTRNLLRSYRAAAMHYGHVEPTNGTAWAQLERLACIIKGSSQKTQTAFLTLLDDEDAAVRYCAAVHALDYELAKNEPLRVLRTIADRQGPLSDHAAIQLLNREAGIDVEL